MKKNYRAVISLEHIERSYNFRREIIKRAYGELYDEKVHLQDAKTPELIKRVKAGQKPLWVRNAYGDYAHVIFDDSFECGISSGCVERWDETDIVSFSVKKNKGDNDVPYCDSDSIEAPLEDTIEEPQFIQNEGIIVGQREYSAELFQRELQRLDEAMDNLSNI